MNHIILDAEKQVVGRVSSYAAKQALLGNEISIINCEKAIISGNEKATIKHKAELRALNKMKPEKGPFFSVDADKIFRRTIRGMLPDFRVGRGRDAWKRIRCYINVPEKFKNEKIKKTEFKIPVKSVTLEQISSKI